MGVRKLLGLRRDGEKSDLQVASETYAAEDWIMSEDIGYTSDWTCPDTEYTSSRGSNWMGATGFILSILALGAALYAAFAPRSVVEQTRQKVGSALSRGASEAQQAVEAAKEKARETVGAHSGSTGAQTTMGRAPGL